ncbi:hypothetical protein FA13DRAFT_1789954 [Coprinellus micaceus]|uniref:DUF6533 domain-containing protein n=1 Tax=Coprinellus micaceus TaxID=71717 RepID=A0A4Y7TH82_COPMI|nr:hypothetical protein FA13DRAFT_1789954 [Coprinellus micaceus]
MPQLNYSQYVQFLVQYASITLIYYDFILTFEREVKYIWRRPRSWAMLLVVCCRYSLIANVVFALGLVNKLDGKGCVCCRFSCWTSLPKYLPRCDYAYIVASSLSMLGRVGILTILGARTCAVFQHNRFVVAFFLLLGLSLILALKAHVPYVSCTGKGRKPPKRTVLSSPGDVLSIMTVVYELMSTLFLAYGCITSARTTSASGTFSWNRKGLVYLIFREGLLYAGFVSLFTTSAMVLVYTTPPGSFAQRSLNALTLPISGMMSVRFLLHLRQWQKGSLVGEFTATDLMRDVPSELRFEKSEKGVEETVGSEMGVDMDDLGSRHRGDEEHEGGVLASADNSRGFTGVKDGDIGEDGRRGHEARV